MLSSFRLKGNTHQQKLDKKCICTLSQNETVASSFRRWTLNTFVDSFLFGIASIFLKIEMVMPIVYLFLSHLKLNCARVDQSNNGRMPIPFQQLRMNNNKCDRIWVYGFCIQLFGTRYVDALTICIWILLTIVYLADHHPSWNQSISVNRNDGHMMV